MFNLFCNRSNAVFAVEFELLVVFSLFCNRSIAIVVVITLGDWLPLLLLLLLLLFSSTLGAAVAVSNTLGVIAGVPVISLFGGENILIVSCSIASLTAVPCCKYGVAGCCAWRMATRSSVALANLSVVDVVGMSTFSGKNSNVFVVLTPLVSGM